MSVNLPVEDYIRCKKCNEPVTGDKVDFEVYPTIPRFIEMCYNCRVFEQEVKKQISDRDKLLNLKEEAEALKKKINLELTWMAKNSKNPRPCDKEYRSSIIELRKKRGFKWFRSQEFQDIIKKENGKGLDQMDIALKYKCHVDTVKKVAKMRPEDFSESNSLDNLE